MSFTSHEQALIAQFPPEVQQLANEAAYQSLFENFCKASSLPELDPGTAVDWLEFYFSDDPEPAYFFAEGKLNSVSCSAIEDPSTFELIGSDGSLYIQVKGHILLNRIGQATLPRFNNQQILENLASLEKQLVQA